MDHYVVSARKYRPSTFGTVIGQKPLTAALKHAIATDRLAHAYLFCGSRGVGKTSCARIFAKTINCQHRTPDGEACNQCESCRTFNEGTSLNIIELDAASHNGIDDMRSLIEQVQVPPTQGRYRVFIIDEVHMLTPGAFNAFLKTLEEPPEYVVFILATTEKHKIIPTILSRCQIYDFNRITIQDMVDHLQHVAQTEGITADPAALNVIARKADGAMRDALSIFDQVAAASMGNITYQRAIDNLNMLDSAYYGRLIDAFLTCNIPQALLIYKEIRDKGFDSQFFINGLGQYIRDLMVAQNPSTLPLLEAADEVKAQMAQVAAKCHPVFMYRAMDLCNDADLNYRVATNKQFLIELTLIKLCQLCSPSPGIDGGGEGQLKPIAAHPKPTPAAPAAQTAPQGAPPAAKPAPAPTQGAPAPTPQQARPAQSPSPGGFSAGYQTGPQARPSQPATPTRPMAAPAPAATGARKPVISLSIKGAPKAAPAQQQAEQAAPRRRDQYTPEALEKAWDEYAQAHPTERILVNTMLASKPKLIDADRYYVSVDDAIQVEALIDAKDDILNHLHQRLGNDFVTFDAVVTQGEASPVTWTQREVLQHMVQDRPVLKDFIDTFNLTLG